MRPQPPPESQPNPEPVRSRPGDDTIWDAYCYLTDVMPADLVARFEDRLAVDRAARDALAEAVQLVGAARFVAGDRDLFETCLHLDGTRPKRRRRRWMLAAASATAAALVLTVWGAGLLIRSRAIEVALAWVDLRSGADAGESAAAPGPDLPATDVAYPTDSNVVDGEGDVVEVSDLAAEQPLPSWVLATIPDSEHAASEGN